MNVNGPVIVPASRPALRDIYLAGLGWVSSIEGDPSSFGTSAAPTAGTIYAVALGYRAGQIVTNTLWLSNVAAAGTNATSVFTGICDASGKMLAQSGNDVANVGWKATGPALITSPLSATWSVPTSGLYYNVFLQVGAWGTTQLTLNRTSGAVTPVSLQLPQATGGTSQTVLPANNSSITLSATSALRYFTAAS